MIVYDNIIYLYVYNKSYLFYKYTIKHANCGMLLHVFLKQIDLGSYNPPCQC